MTKKIFHTNTIIPAFDDFLFEQGLRFSAIAVGGSALNILGIIDRPTQDLDLLTSPIPPVVLNAARAFATLQNIQFH